MEIDKSGRDNQTRSVDLVPRLGRINPADPRNEPALDADIAAKARHPRTVDNHSIFDYNIEFRHRYHLSVIVAMESARGAEKQAPSPQALSHRVMGEGIKLFSPT
jgi:hypothetical protein